MAFYFNEQPIFAMMVPEMVPEYYQQRNPSRSQFQRMMVPEMIPEMDPEYYQPRNYSRRQFQRMPSFVDELIEDVKEIEFEQNRSGFMNENDFLNAVALALNKNEDTNETSENSDQEDIDVQLEQNNYIFNETSESEDSDQEDKEYSKNENVQHEQNHSGSNMKTALLKAVALALAQDGHSEGTSNNSDERNIKNSKNEIIQNNTDKSIENQKNVEVATKKIKLANNKIRINEDLEKMQIHIELIGYKFKGEHLDIRVFNEDILEVKAEDGDQKFEKQFKVPSKGDIENIQSKFMVNDEGNKQSLSITIPKTVKIVQVPIAMDEQ